MNFVHSGWHARGHGCRLGISLLLMLSAAPAPAESELGIVYVVLAVDTEPLHTSGAGKRFEIDLSNFAADPDSGYVVKVMAEGWRMQFHDSFDGHPKFTWFVLTSQHICEVAGCSAVLRAMRGLQESIDRWGDEIAWHYHHTDWVACAQGESKAEQWNQLVTFDGSLYHANSDSGLCENALNHLLVNEDFFPASFRSGWVWENTDFSNWLEDVLAFDLSSSPPYRLVSPEPARCRSNESDWSRAPLDWRPYHPDAADYQVRGRQRRWLSRSLVRPLTVADYDQIAAVSDSGFHQVLSIPTHSYSNLRHVFTTKLVELTRELTRRQVPFRFATTREAFNAATGTNCTDDLNIQFLEHEDGLAVKIRGPLWQRFPYVVVEDSTAQLDRIVPRATGERLWLIEVPVSTVTQVVAAAITPDGRVQIARYPARAGKL